MFRVGKKGTKRGGRPVFRSRLRQEWIPRKSGSLERCGVQMWGTRMGNGHVLGGSTTRVLRSLGSLCLVMDESFNLDGPWQIFAAWRVGRVNVVG